MQIHLYLKKLILFLLLCVLVASGVHTVPASPSVVTAQSGDNSVFMRASSFCQPDDCLAEQISSRRNTPTLTNQIRSTRTGISYRFLLLFLLCTLTLLSVFANLIENLITLHDTRYLYEENFIISFIQAIDGRKRIS